MLVDTSVWIDYLNGYASSQAEYLANAIAADTPPTDFGQEVTIGSYQIGLQDLQ